MIIKVAMIVTTKMLMITITIQIMLIILITIMIVMIITITIQAILITQILILEDHVTDHHWLQQKQQQKKFVLLPRVFQTQICEQHR